MDSEFGYPLPNRQWIIDSKLINDRGAQRDALNLLELMTTEPKNFYHARQIAEWENRRLPFRTLCGAILVYIFVHWDHVRNRAASLENLVSDFGPVAQIYQPLASDVAGMGYITHREDPFVDLLREYCRLAIAELIADNALSSSNRVL
ncbi:hypothetical protein [uncultured Parasphingopyxis sp.]|uniref:hypothetical protein n=1 Tax=uncultured Parasphingopyxis sp. TaxID=1547918 RepID=UPI00262E4CB2|nr:hypothetical protein [uncultured Parasphingopyxis sp.]